MIAARPLPAETFCVYDEVYFLQYGRAPIHWASSRGSTDIMQLLIEARCDIEAKDKYGMSPILMAAWHGHKDAVQLLIKCGANALVVNKVSAFLLQSAKPDTQENIFYEKTLSEALFSTKSLC